MAKDVGAAPHRPDGAQARLVENVECLQFAVDRLGAFNVKDRGHLSGCHGGTDVCRAAAQLEAALRSLFHAKQQRGHFHRRGQRHGLAHFTRERRVHIVVVHPVLVLGAGHEDGEEAPGETATLHARQVEVALAVAVDEVAQRIALGLAPQPQQQVIVAVEYRNHAWRLAP